MTALTPQQMRELAGRAVQSDDGHTYSVPARDLVEYSAALRAAADQLDAVHEALSRHPKCDKYDEDDVVSCGWKSAVRDITWVLNRD